MLLPESTVDLFVLEARLTRVHFFPCLPWLLLQKIKLKGYRTITWINDFQHQLRAFTGRHAV